MFSFPFLVAVTSSVFWIFPAIRNYRTKLFLYFFILAISDPINMLIIFLIPHMSTTVYVFSSFLLVASLKDFFSTKKFYYGLLSLLFVAITAAAFSPYNIRYIVIISAHICIAFIFVGMLLSNVALNSNLKGFHIVLVFYELSLILKVLFIVLNVELGLSYFYTTSIFEMLIAVFFSFYKETDEKLLIDLRNV